MFEDLFIEDGLSLERLHALVQLSEAGSLIRAAKDDPIRQSRYSHYLRQLSGFFGTKLTMRVGKSIKLTAAGERLVRLAREHFKELEQFRRDVRHEAQEFRLGASDSIHQWLVAPAVGALRRPGHTSRLVLESHRTNELVARLDEQRLDFGLLRADAVPKGLKAEPVCKIRYAIVVPERLVPQRGMLTLKNALFNCPHVAMGSDGQMNQRIQQLASDLGRRFLPDLVCDSLSHCVMAVRSGFYAAILPLKSWTTAAETPCHVVEDASLDILDHDVTLAWHPRLMEVRGTGASTMKSKLLAVLRDRGALDD
ncbi:MAG TPA: LysR family transcriptional regulator [Chthoniobacter sp.]